MKKCYTYNNNNIDIDFNTTDIKISDYNHDEINHNLVARQYIKVWGNRGVGISAIASGSGTTRVASAGLNWLTGWHSIFGKTIAPDGMTPP